MPLLIPKTSAGGGGAGLYAVTAAPKVADFAWVNQGGATAVDMAYGLYMSKPSTGANNTSVLDKALAGTQWTVKAGIVPIFQPSGFPSCGIALRNATSGLLQIFGLIRNGGASEGYAAAVVANWTNPTTYSADVLAPTNLETGKPAGLRIRQDAATRYFEASLDGTNWILVHSVAAGNFVVPDRCGLFVNGQTSTSGRVSGMSVLDFAVS